MNANVIFVIFHLVRWIDCEIVENPKISRKYSKFAENCKSRRAVLENAGNCE